MLLQSETGMAFALHFCGDKLVTAQLNISQENNSCDMENNDCDSFISAISKSNCCAASEIRMAQISIYEIFTFDWVLIRIPIYHVQSERLYSYAFLENLRWDIIESPPPYQNVRRSRLQVYLI